MADLPLFPLNTVLFPGMQLKLHIFEERYKLMINHCIDTDAPFGVVLIQDGQEALGPLAKPHEIGCTAQITQVQRLPFERLNITATGQRRFRIHSIKQHSPYLIGDVEFFAPEDDQPDLVDQLGRQLRPLIARYLEILSQIGEVQFNAMNIPHDARSLAHVAAIMLQGENPQKQELLSADRTSDLLLQLLKIYQLETKLLEVRVSPPQEGFDIGPFSSN